ncbi:MAG: hypothetical protein GX542_02190 [Rhodococcus sp.]|nr:hypothetical protein [Rhodococcus sp. (in: high G+C Gram-positive bacteria)]
MTEMTFGNFQDDDPPARPMHPQVAPTAGPSVVTMTLDSGRLPVTARLDSQWDRKVSPHEMGDAIFQGYVAALWEHDRDALESGRFELLSSFPSRRTRLLALLDASTLDEHRAIVDSFFSGGTYVGRSQVLDRWDDPVVTLTADRGTILSATASTEWIATAPGDVIADQILYCADQLRSTRPGLRSTSTYDGLSDREVEERYADHLGELTRRAAS